MDDTYDDGLVHCHNWACGPETPAAGTTLTGAEATTAAASIMAASPVDESFDDGLVHGHDWARG